MSTTSTLNDMLKQIRQLRDSMPEFNPNEIGSKERIEANNMAIHNLTLIIKDFVGFETYEQAIKFIDQEIANAA